MAIGPVQLLVLGFSHPQFQGILTEEEFEAQKARILGG
jgi:Short C-terminal domain